MKATGIVRRIDELGRVVIPKEIRRTQRIRRGDPLEIFTTGDGEVIFKKYSPVGEMSGVAAQYTEVLSRCFALTAFVADRDRILAVSGSGRRELADRSISQPLERLMEGRKLYQSDGTPENALSGSGTGAVVRRTHHCCRGRHRCGGASHRGPHRHSGPGTAEGGDRGGSVPCKTDGGIKKRNRLWSTKGTAVAVSFCFGTGGREPL